MLRRFLLLTLALLAGCVADPQPPVGPPAGGPDSLHGVLVVNEGLWRHDDATLTYYDPHTGTCLQDYFALRNPGLRLGDVANSGTLYGGRAYIAVSTSGTVEVIDCKTGISAGRVRMPAGNQPRGVAIVSSHLAMASCFGDSVVVFDPESLAVLKVVHAGPAPEGIVSAEGRVLVAISGLGELRRSEEGAGTLAVFGTPDAQRITSIPIGPNPRELRAVEATGRIYALYGLPDSLGGVAEIDAHTLAVLRRWEITNARDLAVDAGGTVAYVIAAEGVVAIDLNAAQPVPRPFVNAADWPARIFYSIAVSQLDGRIYAGTLTNYAAPGEVLVFDRSGGAAVARFPCGINPGWFVCY